MIGPLIKQVVDRLPPEKRKGYLFNPTANLTYESMIETILNKDGISSEMIKAQQERVMLIEKLIQMTSPDARLELIKQNEKIIDEQFFGLVQPHRAKRHAKRTGTHRARIDRTAKTTAGRDSLWSSAKGICRRKWKPPQRSCRKRGKA